MKSVVFNIHDVALIVTVAACALLGSRHIGGWCRPQWSGYFFGLFLAVNALVAINTLVLWAEPIRHPVFSMIPYLYLFLGAVGFMLGPLLYWQLKVHLNPRFRFDSTQYLHFLPALIGLAYLYMECFRFPHEVQRELLLNLQLYQQPNAFYADFITLKKLLPVAYGVLCLGTVMRHAEGTEKRVMREEITHEQLCVVGGFTAIWLWAFITHFFGTVRPGEVSDGMGIVGNYLQLALIALLICRGSPKSPQAPVAMPGKNADQNTLAPIDEDQIEKITHAMKKEQAFLNPQLTLERFAEMVQCSPREVSMIINRHFHQNFHEFVSSYRIDNVKRHLRDPEYHDWTISDIAQAAGFNSKATFHRFFKKAEATTPSQYRKHHRPTSGPLPTSSRAA